MASKYRALVAARARQSLITRGATAAPPSVRNLVQRMSLNLSKAAAFKAKSPPQDFFIHLPVSALGSCNQPGKQRQFDISNISIISDFGIRSLPFRAD